MTKSALYETLKSITQQAEAINTQCSEADKHITLAHEHLVNAMTIARIEAEEEQANLLTNFRGMTA